MVTQTIDTSSVVSESAIEATKKKIRNLEKRKQKLDKLKEKLNNGEKLDNDQKAALGQYEFVLGGLTVSKEMLKGFVTLNSEALELQSKQKTEQAQIVHEEKEVIVQQSVGVIEILRCMYCYKQVQDDLVSGDSPVLDENELKMLMDFYNVHLNLFNHKEGLNLVGTASVVGETLFALLSSDDDKGSDYNKVYSVFRKLFESDYFSKLPLIHQTELPIPNGELVEVDVNDSEDSLESTKNEGSDESLVEENIKLDEVSLVEDDGEEDIDVNDVIKTEEFVASKPADPQPEVLQLEDPEEEVQIEEVHIPTKYEFMVPDEEEEEEEEQVEESIEQPNVEGEQEPEAKENEENLPIKAWLNKVCNNQFPVSSFSFEFEGVPTDEETTDVPSPESVAQPESNGTESPVADLALPAHISSLPLTVSPTVEATGLPPASFGISPSPAQNHLHHQPTKYENIVVTNADESNHLYTEVHQQLQAPVVEISAPNHNHIQMPPQLAQQTLSSMLPPALQSVPDPLPMPKEDSNYSQFQAGDMGGLVENSSSVEPAQTRRPRHDSLRASQQILGDTVVVTSSPRKNEPVSSTINQQDSNVENAINTEHMQSPELHPQVRNNSYSNNPTYTNKPTYRVPQQQVNNSPFYSQQQQRQGRPSYQQPGRNNYYNGQRNFQPTYNQGYRNDGMSNGGDPYGQRKFYRPANGQRGGNNGTSYRSRSFRPQSGADQANY